MCVIFRVLLNVAHVFNLAAVGKVSAKGYNKDTYVLQLNKVACAS